MQKRDAWRLLLVAALTPMFAFARDKASGKNADAAPVLPEISVTAPAEESGYTAYSASTALKTDTPIMETPFSVQVVPNQVIKDQQAIRLQDVTQNVSGVQTNFGYGGLYEAFAIRGFETNNTLRNGMRIAGGIGRSFVEVANLDSVEVLKGPAAMLYGRLEPGGMINVITKRPQPVAQYSLQQQFGSYNLFRTVADATGPVTKDGSMLYRLIYSYFDADQFIDNAPHGRTHFLNPGITWRPNNRFELNLNLEYRNSNPLIANGIPAIGRKPASIPITTYLGGDVGDTANVDRKLIDFNWSYQFHPDWKIRNGLAIAYDKINFEQFFGSSLDETPGPTFGNFTNSLWYDKRNSKGYNVFLDITGHFRTYDVDHTVLAGTDYYLLDFADVGYVAGFGPLDDITNIFNPVFRRSTAYGMRDVFKNTPPDWTSVGTQEWNGVYFQDQMKFWNNKLHLLLGGRYDWATNTTGGVLLEFAPPGTTINDITKTTSHQQKFSPRVGLVFQPAPWLSFYGNYTESLGTWGTSNVIAIDETNKPLPAERSQSYEGGLKVESPGGRLRSTLAFFGINKTNVATRDLSSPNPLALRAVGEARSRGIEWDVSGQLTDKLSLIANYAYTDARFTKDALGLQGNRIANVPEHSGSVWAKYQLLPQFAIGSGVYVRGDRAGDNQNSFKVFGYAILNAYASYSFKVGRSKITTQLNVDNILDKRYFINTNVYDANPRLGIMPGQPLTFMGSVRLEF